MTLTLQRLWQTLWSCEVRTSNVSPKERYGSHIDFGIFLLMTLPKWPYFKVMTPPPPAITIIVWNKNLQMFSISKILTRHEYCTFLPWPFPYDLEWRSWHTLRSNAFFVWNKNFKCFFIRKIWRGHEFFTDRRSDKQSGGQSDSYILPNLRLQGYN